MITFRGVTKRFPGASVPALHRTDLDLEVGGVVGLIGRNGAGKSTLVRLAVGMTRPTDGEVRIDGHDPATEPDLARRALGWVPERPRFPPSETPGRLLRHLARLDGRSSDEARRRAVEGLGRVGLAALAERRIGTLSQGETRRLALAVAWLGDPTRLFYDEVTNGLDPPGRELLAASLRELRARGGLALLASNRLDEVEAWCDRVLVLRDGRISASADLRGPASRRARRVRITVARGPTDRSRELSAVGAVGEAPEGLTVELLAPDDRDVVGPLAAQGFRVVRVESIRAELAQLLNEVEP